MSATLVIETGYMERRYWRDVWQFHDRLCCFTRCDRVNQNDGIIKGETGTTFKRQNAAAPVRAVQKYFQNDLHLHLESRRHEILRVANKEHSRSAAGSITTAAYKAVLHEMERPLQPLEHEVNNETVSLDSHTGLRL